MSIMTRFWISARSMMLQFLSEMPADRDVWLTQQTSVRLKNLYVSVSLQSVHGIIMFRLWLKDRDTFHLIR